MTTLVTKAGKGSALAAACLAVLVGCSNSPAGEDAVVAEIGGQKITAAEFKAYTLRTAKGEPGKLDAAYRERLLKDLVRLHGAAQAGERAQTPASRYELDFARLEALAKEGATAAGVFKEPSTSELRAAYEAFVKSRPASEFHVAHILVPTEAMALGAIRKLAAGQPFAAVAKTDSLDTSRDKGGDIGWVYPGKLPPAFTDAVQTLKPGKHTAKPVKTIYGWHVIKVVETRGSAAPPLENVKAQLVVNMQQERYKKYLEGMRP